MTDNISKITIDGRTGHEIIGNIAVIRVDHEIGDPREFHLELEIDDHLADHGVAGRARRGRGGICDAATGDGGG